MRQTSSILNNNRAGSRSLWFTFHGWRTWFDFDGFTFLLGGERTSSVSVELLPQPMNRLFHFS